MITKWKVFNFKSIRDETELTFAPLTIFAGSNSSGKSSLIQSILMIGQTLSSKISSRSVVLNGDLIRLGQFDDLRSYESEVDQIAIGWECQPRQLDGISYQGRNLGLLSAVRFMAPNNVKCEITFDADPSNPQRDVYQLQPRLFSIRAQAEIRNENGNDIHPEIAVTRSSVDADQGKLSSLSITGLDFETIPTGFSYDVSLDDDATGSILEEITTAEVIGCQFHHFLPKSLYLRVDQALEEAHKIAKILCDDNKILLRRRVLTEQELSIPLAALNIMRELSEPAIDRVLDQLTHQPSLFPTVGVTVNQWLTELRRLQPAEILRFRDKLQAYPNIYNRIVEIVVTSKMTSLDGKDQDRYSLQTYSMPRNIYHTLTYMDRFFSTSVKYLGPLRDEPKPLYPLSGANDTNDVGLKGEMTASILDTHKDQRITYIPTSGFKSSTVDTRIQFRTLETAVVDWLRYLGVAENINTRDRGKLGHELQVKLEGTEQTSDLTHVGVGVSQVLPIVVMCLLAEPDTTLIFEQPELHLHPKVQTLLGDFFLSMALLGKQCIIETHSEYLINRLRFRAASAPIESPISSHIKTYFVEKKEGRSIFREVVVNDYGAITDWPDGFFDQSQREAEEILRAAAKKRKSQREKA